MLRRVSTGADLEPAEAVQYIRDSVSVLARVAQDAGLEILAGQLRSIFYAAAPL